jgi:hypothetical protein
VLGGASGGPLGGGLGGALGGGAGGGVGGGRGNGRKNTKNGSKNGSGNGNAPRVQIDGLSDADIALKVAEIADRHQQQNGGEALSPTALSNKYMVVGFNRAKELVTAHYARTGNN